MNDDLYYKKLASELIERIGCDATPAKLKRMEALIKYFEQCDHVLDKGLCVFNNNKELYNVQ